MNPLSNSSLLFRFSLFLLFSGNITGRSLISNVCRTISKQDPNVKFSFCTTSLQSAPASGCASLRGLAMISIRLTRYNITDTRCYIKELLEKRNLNPHLKPYLNDCFELYSDAIPNVKLAMKNFNSNKYDDANIELSAVMDAATTCEDGFSEREGLVSPLTKRSNDTFELSAIALSFLNLIQHNGSLNG